MAAAGGAGSAVAAALAGAGRQQLRAMRRWEPWYLFCGDAAFAEAQLVAEIRRCGDAGERASLLHLLSRLGGWDPLAELLNGDGASLEHADGRAALFHLQQHQGHPNPWLALLLAEQQEAFLQGWLPAVQQRWPLEIRLTGGLGDQLEGLALVAGINATRPGHQHCAVSLPASSRAALEPLLERRPAAALLPRYRFLADAESHTPAEATAAWIGLSPWRALLAAHQLGPGASGKGDPVAVGLWAGWRGATERRRQLVVCWRSKVDRRERLWAHLRSLGFSEILATYRWLLPWAVDQGIQVVDVTPYSPQEEHSLGGLPGRENLVALQGQLRSLADTAAAVAAAALVVSVDTALIHLAHALESPRWLLLHRHGDARWRQRLQQDGGSDHQQLGVLQQTVQGQWHGPLGQLRADLAKLGL
ncbi:MAG: hypothetical protein FJ051_00165 [Cyanobacteria bacterium M_surface_9_m1_291]|nr:hypothetical protein [Cyanobacteria bacterium M_surface_9_m1_291]